MRHSAVEYRITEETTGKSISKIGSKMWSKQ